MVTFCRLSQTEPEKEGYIILGITGNNMRGIYNCVLQLNRIRVV